MAMMTLAEFLEQDEYCRKQNTPEGKGCDNCPSRDKVYCADALRNLCDKFRHNIGKPGLRIISEQLEKDYGLLPYSQIEIVKGILEFSE